MHIQRCITVNLVIYCVQAFVSEYAVTGNDAGKGSLLAGLAEAGFLIGLEKNRCALCFHMSVCLCIRARVHPLMCLFIFT